MTARLFLLANGIGDSHPAACRTTCELRVFCVEDRYGRIFGALPGFTYFVLPHNTYTYPAPGTKL